MRIDDDDDDKSFPNVIKSFINDISINELCSIYNKCENMSIDEFKMEIEKIVERLFEFKTESSIFGMNKKLDTEEYVKKCNYCNQSITFFDSVQMEFEHYSCLKCWRKLISKGKGRRGRTTLSCFVCYKKGQSSKLIELFTQHFSCQNCLKYLASYKYFPCYCCGIPNYIIRFQDGNEQIRTFYSLFLKFKIDILPEQLMKSIIFDFTEKELQSLSNNPNQESTEKFKKQIWRNVKMELLWEVPYYSDQDFISIQALFQELKMDILPENEMKTLATLFSKLFWKLINDDLTRDLTIPIFKRVVQENSSHTRQ
ncbi:unnamed protein product [Dimorphilus gyrociliatus]|uniref:Uncharacterized protein n=1 Tax=Dimorphilus gyrociliatus TaxID=2664684 RepID=A0A7I8WF96_9ANNE|nr:unnamed protein product [Dimorphilus gyrociliatus]